MIEITAKFYAPNLRKYQEHFQLAIARGINEGGDKVRTQVKRALKTQTGVTKYKFVTEKISTMRAYPGFMAGALGKNLGSGFSSHGSMSYIIVGRGKGLSIDKFPVRETPKGIVAKTWGVDHLFKRSFGIKGRGVEGFRARTSEERFPIRKLYGPSIAKELTKDESARTFVRTVPQYVPPAIAKHILKAARLEPVLISGARLLNDMSAKKIGNT